MLRRSLAGRLLLWVLPLVALAALLPMLLLRWLDDAVLAVVLTLLVVIPLAAWVLRQVVRPVMALMRALSGTVESYRDGEYNFGVHWPGHDELAQLVAAHGALGEVLRQQRQGLVQRELLLDAMVQNTPVAMLLIAPGGDGDRRVVFANVAARQLLNSGWQLDGQRFDALIASAPAELREALARGADSLFVVEPTPGSEADDEQLYHLSRRDFRLNGRIHQLILLRRLTSELRRQEVLTWKKVIRVISHELNNSLAPIASLARSGAELLRRGRSDRLDEVFATIQERATHLEQFIGGYARFAKLPAPQLQRVDWSELLSALQRQLPFQLQGAETPAAGYVDRAQIEQALLNLLKNAHESGSAAAEVGVRFSVVPEGPRIEVLDRGPGMSDVVLQNALTPFYSTKRQGTGLGLALTREIVEAHGGRLSLHNRRQGGLCVTMQLKSGS